MRLLILTEDENGRFNPTFRQMGMADLCIEVYKNNTFKIIKNRYGPNMKDEDPPLPVNQIHEVDISRQNF